MSNESPYRIEPYSTRWAPLLKKDIPAFLAYSAGRYPLLTEVLDRVERELIREGVDLSGLAEDDLPVFETLAPKPDSGTAPRT